MYKFLITLGLFSVLVAFSATPIYADQYGCQTQYGGGTNCSTIALTISKTVQNPQTGDFVDNLGVNDPKFSPDQTITFQVAVANTGNNVLNHIDVTDNFPQDITFVSGPGSFNSSTKTLTFGIDNLNPNATQTFTITAKANSASQLPANAGIVCDVNTATAVATSGPSAQVNSGFCIQNNVLGAQTKGGLTVFPSPNLRKTPGTGPEALSLLALLPAAFGGLMLKKKAIRG